ncbi:acyl-CoA dehydrogenase family protein [Mycobacterium sp. NAZ190054]|uniref:acyl-CoA dehydrogenase family protein n=1 Tax=Mycobacterium sp. NAZ190054 TaxID=1747766 RepID=UPI000793A27C|nr:acyl-CoA dehydrogenase family protein [Mycobacterium sp. NAZ190054]KWX69289.1 acyl-CoA dehydrogenase [Mycobacterium sp. NAZ190054]
MAADTEDLCAYRRSARRWIEANLAPRAESAVSGSSSVQDRTAEEIAQARTLQRKLFENGYAGIDWPTEYGGQGLSESHAAAFADEAKDFELPDFGMVGGTTFGVVAPTLLRHASPDFMRLHGPRILAGDELWVQFFSEPGAGSDLAGVTTRADWVDDHWVLNGAKMWTSGGQHADWGMCLARTDWDAPKHGGLTWFAVQASQPGVRILPITKIDKEADFCQEFLDNVEVAPGDVIGDVNSGWSIARTILLFERGGFLPEALLPKPATFAADLVALAQRSGGTDKPAVRQAIGRAYVNDYALTQIAQRIVGLVSSGQVDPAGIAAYGKLAQGTFNPIRAVIALSIGQQPALTWAPGSSAEMAAANAYLNCRLMSIAGGTNEMQRSAIGERVLGLPREPSFDSGEPFREVLKRAAEWSAR